MKQLCVLVIFAVLFLGCSSKELLPGSETVRIYQKSLPAQECTFLGEVIGSDGNMFTFLFISNEALMYNALKDLKSETLAKGGNTVHLLDEQLSFASSVTLLGQAYHCK